MKLNKWIREWSVDEVAECLPMVDPGHVVYKALWAFVTEDSSPDIETVWEQVPAEHQKIINDAAEKI
jgi:hypothetical protein